MPMYHWRCAVCEKSTDVMRHYESCGDPPTEEEHPEACMETAEHEWKKVILPPKMARGVSWGGSKGNW